MNHPLIQTLAKRARRSHAMCLLALSALLSTMPVSAQVRWEDYRGQYLDSTSNTPFTSNPYNLTQPAFDNDNGRDPIGNLRAIATSANAVRTGNAPDIDFTSSSPEGLCGNANVTEPCDYQAQGKVVYARVVFPVAGNYEMGVAHDDNTEVALSSDYQNTNYRSVNWDIPVGEVGAWTNSETDYESIGTFNVPQAGACALIRIYWTNQNGKNFQRLGWIPPSGGGYQQLTNAEYQDPSAPPPPNTCSGSINNNQPGITLNKTVASRAVTADQFVVSIGTSAGGAEVGSATTTGTATTATTGAKTAQVGTTYYLSDAMAGGSTSNLNNDYTAAISCTDNGNSFVPNGAAPTWNVTPASGQNIVCTIVNTAKTRSANLQVTKTNTPAYGASDQAGDTVLKGSTQTYTIVVTNNGPDGANGAIVRDPATSGLTCTSATCTGNSGGAACPTQASGSALLTALQSSGGAEIPTLPNAGEVTLTVTCTVD